jgi:NAD(P)-dependent dehydrogenase (short-subunit alcohol dehydrogenase family)
MSKVAVVTGAGSGVGRAVVARLAGDGWNVALIGRSIESLKETISLTVPVQGARLEAYPCDIGDQRGIHDVSVKVEQSLGGPSALVNSAGTKVPKRSLDVLTPEAFDTMIRTNLNGAFYLANAFLPAMKRAGGGTIVNIVSDAAIIPNAKAGAGYSASKFGVRGLTQSINIEQRQHGIRATGIFPGDINTPLLNRRPVPPSPEQRAQMLQPEDVAECVMLAINLPARAVVEELLVRPRY